MTFKQAVRLISSARDEAYGKPLDSHCHTYLKWRGQDTLAVHLYSTDILAIHRDGRYVLSAWDSSLTRKRIGEFSPCWLWSSGGDSHVSYGGRHVVLKDGLTLHPCGGMTYDDGTVPLSLHVVTELRRRAYHYSVIFTNRVRNYTVRMPGNPKSAQRLSMKRVAELVNGSDYNPLVLLKADLLTAEGALSRRRTVPLSHTLFRSGAGFRRGGLYGLQNAVSKLGYEALELEYRRNHKESLTL